MAKRMEFCLSKVDLNTGEFYSMEQCVHVDEKWFFRTQKKLSTLLKEKCSLKDIPRASGSCDVLVCHCASQVWFFTEKDVCGKTGYLAFREKEPAKCSNVNRAKGTLETKPISVDDQVYSDFIKKKYCLQFVKKCPMVISILNKLIP